MGGVVNISSLSHCPDSIDGRCRHLHGGDILPRPRSYLQASSLRKELVWASGNRCEHYDGVMIRTRKQSGCKCREAWYGRWSTCRMSLVSLRPLPPLTVAGR